MIISCYAYLYCLQRCKLEKFFFGISINQESLNETFAKKKKKLLSFSGVK